jgi:hypothetical protein
VKRANDTIDKASISDLIDIMQGFRKRASKDMFMKIRKTLIDRKNKLFAPVKKGEEK